VKFVTATEGAAILSGAALAAVLGVLLGGSMRPQLIFDGRPMGPQIFAEGGGARSTGPFDMRDAYAAYGGKLPTYVTGTDYLQAAYVDEPAVDEPAAAEEPQPAAREQTETQPPAPVARAAYGEPRGPVVIYPSEAGGFVYRAAAPPSAAPPAPPQEDPIVVVG
jgi:hypothetical protein